VTQRDRTGPDRADRVVPVYALTRGRTRPSGTALPLETLVTTTERAAQHGNDTSLELERRAIVKMCTRPTSVAEVGAALRVPIGVARVLVSELASAGLLTVHMPKHTDGDGGPGPEILGRLLDGLRAR
jgi:Protein of unknown function (DUF742)